MASPGRFRVRGEEFTGRDGLANARARALELVGSASVDTYGRVTSVALFVPIERKFRDRWGTVLRAEWNGGNVRIVNPNADDDTAPA